VQRGTVIDYRRRRFGRVYTDDVRLLAKVDRAHKRLSGPATRRILEREHLEYGHPEYVRLAQIPVAHLYNLRKRPDYRKAAAYIESTHPPIVSIGERRRPDPGAPRIPAALERTAKSASDTEFAERMRRAKMELLRACKVESPIPPRWQENTRPGRGTKR
jgi:hypothetical protein